MLKVVPTAARQVHDINRLWVMPWPKTGPTHYHALLSIAVYLDVGYILCYLVLSRTPHHSAFNLSGGTKILC